MKRIPIALFTVALLVGGLAGPGCGGNVDSGPSTSTCDGCIDAALESSVDATPDASPEAGECKAGEVKNVDCNTCVCSTDLRWGCTKKGCLDSGPAAAGSVDCDGKICSTVDHACCDSAEPPAAPDEACVLATTPCAAKRACDEAADCATGEVCCQVTSAAAPLLIGTECRPKGSCLDSDYSPQFCKTDAECDNGKTCVVQPCRGRTISTCGLVRVDRCK